MPPSVKLLGPTSPQFSNPNPQPPVFKSDWRHCCLLGFYSVIFIQRRSSYTGYCIIHLSRYC